MFFGRKDILAGPHTFKDLFEGSDLVFSLQLDFDTFYKGFAL